MICVNNAALTIWLRFTVLRVNMKIKSYNLVRFMLRVYENVVSNKWKNLGGREANLTNAEFNSNSETKMVHLSS